MQSNCLQVINIIDSDKTIRFYVLGKFTTKISSIEPNLGIDRYRRPMVSNWHQTNARVPLSLTNTRSS